MAFTVNDVRDLTQFLTLHPEWLGEVRRIVLTDELLSLPAIARELAQAQVRTEQRVEELAQAQARTEARLEALTARLEVLSQIQGMPIALMLDGRSQGWEQAFAAAARADA
jgi:hypothetical protein